MGQVEEDAQTAVACAVYGAAAYKDNEVYLQIVARWAIGTILLLGSIPKLWDFKWFAEVLAKYRLTPKGTNKLVAFLVISLELTAAIALLRGRWLPWSAYFASAIFLAFTVAIFINLARGRFDIPCGCNGFWKKTQLGWHLIFRNVGLTGLALLCSKGENLATSRISLSAFILSLGLFTLSFFPKPACRHEANIGANDPLPNH